ncbi:MAG: acyltransferase [Bryobacteraceae bacterium]
MSQPAPREYGLDWLRVAAFGALIFYHSGMIFVPWEFHIKNPEIAHLLIYPMLFFNRFRLPLLFFISGCGVAFSLRRRGWGEFAGERLRRLLIPVVFGMFVIIPPQIYYERLQQGAKFASYGEFYRTVLELVPYPKGSFSWHHLWFVVYILVYSLVCIPVFAWLRGDSGRGAIASLARLCERWPAAIYLVNVPSIVNALVLGPRWPVTHNLIADWANLAGSLITFLWGFVFASSPALLDLVERRRSEFLAGWVASVVVFFGVLVTDTQPGPFAWTLINAYYGMFAIFALVGYARATIHSGGAWLSYATEAVYPFYIVHQTIIVAAGYYIVQQAWSVSVKLAVTMAVTAAGSWLAFEVVRRTRVTRLLFGLKPSSGTEVPRRLEPAPQSAGGD